MLINFQFYQSKSFKKPVITVTLEQFWEKSKTLKSDISISRIEKKMAFASISRMYIREKFSMKNKASIGLYK